MAPEILKEEDYSYAVDWFAMGCSIYEMIAARTPFKDFKEKVGKDEVKRRTLEDEVKFEHANFTEEAKDICRLFLAKKTENRLGSRYALLLKPSRSQIKAANSIIILHITQNEVRSWLSTLYWIFAFTFSRRGGRFWR